MNYNSIILEMLSRIQELESKVEILSQQIQCDEFEDAGTNEQKKKATMADIRKYIEEQIDSARNNGEQSITLKASQIHNALKLSQRYPMVCNAMRQCMKHGDTVVFETPSGYSSTLEIMYFCVERRADDDRLER